MRFTWRGGGVRWGKRHAATTYHERHRAAKTVKKSDREIFRYLTRHGHTRRAQHVVRHAKETRADTRKETRTDACKETHTDACKDTFTDATVTTWGYTHGGVHKKRVAHTDAKQGCSRYV